MILSRKLLPSLFLLLLYFLADEFLSPVTGMFCMLLLGGTEFLYIRIKERSADWMILGMTVLFCLPGLLEIYGIRIPHVNSATFFAEAGISLLSGILAFSRIDPASTLPVSVRREIRLTPQQSEAVKNMFKWIFYLLTGHLLLLSAALFLLPSPAASFIGGPLLYLLIGGFFVFFIFRRYRLLRRYRKEEWLPLVDEKGRVTGKAPRSLCHSGSKLLHPVVHLHIVDAVKGIFLQKRSLKKDLLPGKWDTAVGGHIGAGESVEEALKRETFEELGITGFEARFMGSYIWESPREKELVYSFLCTRYNRIDIRNEEVDEGRFWTLAEIEAHLEDGIFTPNFIREYRTLLRQNALLSS